MCSSEPVRRRRPKAEVNWSVIIDRIRCVRQIWIIWDDSLWKIINPSLPLSSESLCLTMPSPFITDHIHDSRSSPQMHPTNKHAADLSRLLDPLYCSPSTSKGYAPQAYVDPYGDLHDPDYRHFPTSSSSSSAKAKRYNSPRPHWQLAQDNHDALDDDSDELDEDDSFFLSTSTAAHPQNHSRYSATRRSSHGRRRLRDSSFSTYSSNYYSPSTTISTLPTSYESDKTVLSKCTDSEEKKPKGRRRLSKGDKEKEKDREALWSGSVAVVGTEAYYRGSLDRSPDLPPTREEEPEDVPVGSTPTSPMGAIYRTTEYVPTCSQSLRRQWQALSLRFRFSVFRAQRKVMRRVHSFLWVWTWLLPSSSSSLHHPYTPQAVEPKT